MAFKQVKCAFFKNYIRNFQYVHSYFNSLFTVYSFCRILNAIITILIILISVSSKFLA